MTMVEQAAAMTRVPEAMRAGIEEYVRLLKELVGEHAKALTLFGAILGGGFDSKRHTVRSVLVVDQVDLAELRRLAEHGAKLGKLSIAAPLIMTPGYVETSLDAFPLELIEIGQQHATVFGDDLFEDLSFKDADIRLQCERELKSVLIGLRQGLLAAAGREKFVNALEVDAAEELLRTLRGMLWLKGQKDAKPAGEVVAAVEKIADRKLMGVRSALDPWAEHGWSGFESLYRDVEALGEVVNGW